MEQWRREEFPSIQRQAKADNTLINFAEEAGARSDYHTGHTWAPLVPRTGARFSLQMLSAISAQGEMRFMVYEGSVTADTFCEFLSRLAEGMERKIYLVVDDHCIHKSGKVQKHPAALGSKIALFFLPPYSSELNADELDGFVDGRLSNSCGLADGRWALEAFTITLWRSAMSVFSAIDLAKTSFNLSPQRPSECLRGVSMGEWRALRRHVPDPNYLFRHGIRGQEKANTEGRLVRSWS